MVEKEKAARDAVDGMSKRELLMNIVTDEEDFDKLAANEKLLQEIKTLLNELLEKPTLTKEDALKYNELVALYKKVRKENEEIRARQNLQDEAIADLLKRQDEIEKAVSELVKKLPSELKIIINENNQKLIDEVKFIIIEERKKDRQELMNNFAGLENMLFWILILLFTSVGLSLISIIMMFLLWRAI